MTATVTVSTKWRAELALDRVLDLAVAQAIGMIQRRTSRGVDKDGNGFAPYSAAYREALVAGGESTKVDLTVTGAYLGGFREHRRVVDAARGVAYALIGPGTGTSEQRSFGEGRARHTGQRSPPHNVLGRYLNQRRPHLGLTPDERKRLATSMVKALVRQRG